MGPSYIDDDGEVRYGFKTPFNHNTLEEAKRTGTACNDESRALQSGKEEADINTMVNRFLKSGLLPQVQIPPTYGDFVTEADYHELQNVLAKTSAEFYKLPADLRAELQNDPARWAGLVNQAIADEDLDRLRELGISVPEKAVQAMLTPPGEKPPEPPKAPQEPPGAPKT